MERINLVRCDDGAIWVTSDEDLNGTESYFKEITDKNEQFLIALAEFFGFEPAELFNF